MKLISRVASGLDSSPRTGTDNEDEPYPKFGGDIVAMTLFCLAIIQERSCFVFEESSYHHSNGMIFVPRIGQDSWSLMKLDTG